MKRLARALALGIIVSCATDSERDVRTVYQAEGVVYIRKGCVFFTDYLGRDMVGCDTSCLVYPGSLAPITTGQAYNSSTDLLKPPLLDKEERMDVPWGQPE